MRTTTLQPLLVASTITACGAPPMEAVDGEGLFRSKELSSSPLNLYSCSTCHDVTPGETNIVKPGAVLAGVTERRSFWGGQENDLRSAIDQCRLNFMGDVTPLDPESPEGVALYEFLSGLEGSAEPVPFTTVRLIDDPLERGDAVRGQDLYDRTCAPCHGAMSTGSGSLAPRVTIVPEQAIEEHEGFTPRLLRLVFIEKVRHGGFFGYGGDMPLFSVEALTDEQLADILEALGLTGE